MRDKHETIRSPSLFYCFVDVGKALVDVPFCYVVPSDVVAKCLKETYREWLAAPGKKGQPHKDHSMRRFVPDFGVYGASSYREGWLTDYREAWHLLKAAEK